MDEKKLSDLMQEWMLKWAGSLDKLNLCGTVVKFIREVAALETVLELSVAQNANLRHQLREENEQRELAEARLAALDGMRLGQFAWEDDDGWHLGCQAMDAQMNTVAQVPTLDWVALADALRAGQEGAGE